MARASGSSPVIARVEAAAEHIRPALFHALAMGVGEASRQVRVQVVQRGGWLSSARRSPLHWRSSRR